ncbi:hypothetical protein FSP39_016490 [Pinctada imbricata]|uniref:Uncharacterized protein n=1 Tax=Pinctada imbricata TaxID=66713 RepID=A0AA88XWY0_PINIB|nr:hypothetical protein FSP39_016490 [Pinctada imbricata]
MSWLELEPPPASSQCIPNLYNKLDAEVIKRTKVLNTILDMRFQFQQRMMVKHYKRTVVVFDREKERNLQYLQKLNTRLPYMSQVPADMHIQDKVKFFRIANDYVRRTPLQRRMMSADVPLERGRQTPLAERREKPFCDRYYTHHYSADVKGRLINQQRRMTQADATPYVQDMVMPTDIEEAQLQVGTEDNRRRSVRFDLPAVRSMGMAKDMAKSAKKTRKTRRLSEVNDENDRVFHGDGDLSDSRRASMIPDSRHGSLAPDSRLGHVTPGSRPGSFAPDSRLGRLTPGLRRDSVEPDSLRPPTNQDSYEIRPTPTRRGSMTQQSLEAYFRRGSIPDTWRGSVSPDSRPKSFIPNSGQQAVKKKKRSKSVGRKSRNNLVNDKMRSESRSFSRSESVEPTMRSDSVEPKPLKGILRSGSRSDSVEPTSRSNSVEPSRRSKSVRGILRSDSVEPTSRSNSVEPASRSGSVMRKPLRRSNSKNQNR